MAAPLSIDLRWRVVRAIEAGLSRRLAAAKYDVSIASAVRWHQLFERTGSVAPGRMGGDRLSHRAEAQAAKVLGWIDAERDLSLVEITNRLADEGHDFAPATIWRLLERHNYTVKKRPHMPQNKSATM